MKKLLIALVLMLSCRMAHAVAPIRYVQISTGTLTRQTGTAVVAGINASTGTVSSMTITGVLLDANLSAGTSAYVYTSRGSSLAPQWLPSGSVGGSSGQIQYNNSGSFEGFPSQVTISSITISTTTAICGTPTNDSAAVGYYGEFMSSATPSAGVSAGANNQFADFVSVTLTPGDWDVSGCVQWIPGSTMTEADIAISSTSGNSGAGLIKGVNYFIQTFTSDANYRSNFIPPFRVSLSVTTTYFLKTQSNYGGAPTINCQIFARRKR
jgi:hypothetical protein